MPIGQEDKMVNGEEKDMTTKQESRKASEKDLHTIYLAGGCFWGMEAYVKRLPGVSSTDVGICQREHGKSDLRGSLS